jgi:hypothetical protein
MIDNKPINPQGWMAEQQAAGRELSPGVRVVVA